MINDLAAIIVKEWKEIFMQRGSLRSGIITVAVLMLMLGVLLPAQEGPAWLSEPMPVLLWTWVSLFLVMSVVADSFAGERERHTLETLLASRLSDGAILYGKMLASILYAWIVCLLGLIVGVVTVNIGWAESEGFLFYPMSFFFATLGISLMGAVLMTAIGILVSLKAESTRQAYQRMSMSLLLLIFIPVLFMQFIPYDLQAPLVNWISNLNLEQAGISVIVFLLALDIVLVAIVSRKFKRSELNL